MSPKVSARSGLAGNKQFPGPIWAISGNFLHGLKQNEKIKSCFLFSLVGQRTQFTRFGVMCWCHFADRFSELAMHLVGVHVEHLDGDTAPCSFGLMLSAVGLLKRSSMDDSHLIFSQQQGFITTKESGCSGFRNDNHLHGLQRGGSRVPNSSW